MLIGGCSGCRRQLVTGNPKTGYDVGTVTSLALVGVAGPRAQATREAAAITMTTLGGKIHCCRPLLPFLLPCHHVAARTCQQHVIELVPNIVLFCGDDVRNAGNASEFLDRRGDWNLIASAA